MKAIVKKDKCIGCGLCVRRCPEVFQLDKEKFSTVIVDSISSNFEEEVKKIAEACPMGAISIEE